MKLLNISTDQRSFEEGSSTRRRLFSYESGFDRCTVIVASSRSPRSSQYGIGERGTVDLVSVHSPYRPILFFKTLATALRYARKSDVVSVQDPYAIGLIGLIATALLRKPLHVQVHTIPSMTILSRLVLSSAKRVRVVAEAIRKIVSPVVHCPIDVLPVYIDVGTYRNAASDTAIRTLIPDTSFLILVISRLEKGKNIDAVIRAFASVADRYPGASMVIVGEGTEKDRLESLARATSTRIAFLPWTHEPARYYKSADLFITLSSVEGYGLTIVESLLAGCPVLATPVGIAEEFIRHGYNSWIVSAPGSAATMLESIMGDSDAYAAVRRNLSAMSFPALLDYDEHRKKMIESFINTAH